MGRSLTSLPQATPAVPSIGPRPFASCLRAVLRGHAARHCLVFLGRLCAHVAFALHPRLGHGAEDGGGPCPSDEVPTRHALYMVVGIAFGQCLEDTIDLATPVLHIRGVAGTAVCGCRPPEGYLQCCWAHSSKMQSLVCSGSLLTRSTLLAAHSNSDGWRLRLSAANPPWEGNDLAAHLPEASSAAT